MKNSFIQIIRGEHTDLEKVIDKSISLYSSFGLNEEKIFYDQKHGDLKIFVYKKKWSEKFDINKFKDSSTQQIICLPIQDYNNTEVFNGPILHFNRLTNQLYNAVQSGDPCLIKINPNNNIPSKITVHDFINGPISHIESLRFVFKKFWQNNVLIQNFSLTEALLLYMLKNAQPNKELTVITLTKSIPPKWHRFFQNLGVRVNYNEKTLNSIEIETLVEIINTTNIIDFSIEINKISPVIPESLLSG